MPDFTMPSLGADMDEGTLLEWLVQPGDRVRPGDVVAVVDTSKSSIEIECFTSGTVERLLVDPGTTVPVGTPLAMIAEPSGTQPVLGPEAPPGGPERLERPDPTAPSAVAAKTAASPEPALAGEPGAAEGTITHEPEPTAAPEPVQAPKPTTGPPPPSVPAHHRRPQRPGRAVSGLTSPLVRHIAENKGVDLAAAHGSGPGGRIARADVERAATATERPPRIRATPHARRLAEELHVDLAQVRGTGDHGAVRAADVLLATEHLAPEPLVVPATAPVPTRRDDDRALAMRRSIAELMSRAKREIPHYYLSTTVDLAATVEWLREQNRSHPVRERLVPAAPLLKAVALAARCVPELNGFWAEDRFVPGTGIHVGVAVSLRGGGLIAPPLHVADTLTVLELMAGLRDLAARARTGRLRASETADPTITVTNLGDQGVQSVFGVIYPPQVALVGFGRVIERPAAVGGLLGVRPSVTTTLSADHRASDGAVGARFLATLGPPAAETGGVVNRSEALDHVKESILTIVPDADFDGVPPDADLRQTFELDSLDFLGFVETLSARTGCRIDEDDYPALTTLSSCADFVVSGAG